MAGPDPRLHCFYQCISWFRIGSQPPWMRRRRSSVVIHETLDTRVQTVCFIGEQAKHTSEFSRVPRQDLVDECPLVHFNGFIVPRVPLHIDLSVRRRLEGGIHVPVHPWSSSPLDNGGRGCGRSVSPHAGLATRNLPYIVGRAKQMTTRTKD